jgi:anthranilate phosphoribosyltransferase
MQKIISTILTGETSEKEILQLFQEMDERQLTVDDLVGGAKALREHMIPVELPGNPIDTTGTGGSGKKTINTSTLVAFLIATAGAKVAKHGNRSASGNCGSFDVLEGLGAKIELTPEHPSTEDVQGAAEELRVKERKIYDELGLVFLFAKTHHPAMKHVASARKKFGKKTIFNLLGPLCNPAGVKRQMIGVGNHHDAELIAGAMEKLGADDSLVVTGEDGLDEITMCESTVIRTIPGSRKGKFHPTTLGLEICEPESIEGGSVDQNVQTVRDLASGKGSDAHRNLVLVNAAHALLLTPLASELSEAFVLAKETLASGKVANLIDRYIQATNDV